jgi:hypothetical protein
MYSSRIREQKHKIEGSRRRRRWWNSERRINAAVETPGSGGSRIAEFWRLDWKRARRQCA